MTWPFEKLLRRKERLLTLHPAKDLQLIEPERSIWQVTGPDPQFILKSKRFPLPPGRYKFTALEASGLPLLHAASVYIDFGEGFQESTHHRIRFVEDHSLALFTELFFD